jgi:hypothetical protein
VSIVALGTVAADAAMLEHAMTAAIAAAPSFAMILAFFILLHSFL